MPTDSGGTYSLPSGSTATTGDTILASEHNTPLNDIASALTARLPVDGSKGMSGALKVADGSQAAPSIAFASETSTGFYKISVGEVGVSIAGTKVLDWTGATFTLPATTAATSTTTGALVVGGGVGVAGDVHVAGTLSAATLSIGALTANNLTINGSTNPFVKLDDGTRTGFLQILSAALQIVFNSHTAMSVDASGNVTFFGTIAASNIASAASLNVGHGLASSGGNIVVDTNNAGGIGGYAMMHNGTGGTLGNGATAAGSALFPISWNSTGTLIISSSSFDALQGTTSTWRYIGGWVLSPQDKGLFIRVS